MKCLYRDKNMYCSLHNELHTLPPQECNKASLLLLFLDQTPTKTFPSSYVTGKPARVAEPGVIIATFV